MPRLLSFFSFVDSLLEEPVAFVAGVPVRFRMVVFGGLGAAAAAYLWLRMGIVEAAIAVALVGVIVGAAPMRIPLSRLLARRSRRVSALHAPMGALVVYFYAGPGEVVVEVDGREYDRVRVAGGLARVELAGLEPGRHRVRLVQGGRVLRELAVVVGQGLEGQGGSTGPRG